MTEFDRINAILTEVGKRDGIEGLCLTSTGTCGLTLTNGVDLCIEWAEFADKLFVYTPLLDLPHDEPERLAVCETLAALNCLSLSQGTLSAHLPSLQVLHQIRLDTVDLNVDRLDSALDALLNERPTVLARIEKALPPPIPDTPRHPNLAAALERIAAEVEPKPWPEALSELEKKGIRFRYRACPEQDIATVEAHCNSSLPAQYRQFLMHTGRGSDLLFAGEGIFFPELMSFRERATRLLLSSGARCVLPANAHVFLIHRERQFLFFHLGVGDDPTVYSYEEGAWGFVQIYQSFSEFMHVSIEKHAEHHEALARFYAKKTAEKSSEPTRA